MFPAVLVSAQGCGESFGQGVPWGFRVPPLQGRLRESVICYPIPVCFYCQVSSPRGTATGATWLPSRTLPDPQHFRPCSQELSGWRKRRLREHLTSTEPYCVQAPCWPPPQESWRFTKAKVQRKGPYSFLPKYIRIQGLPAGPQ